ncbi:MULTISPECIES: N-acetylmuramoyl-L-alanine amidase [Paenibacillus]|nr:N-acetylmuramoyl-L-alanine amidase [Paenibacillus lautus]
MKKVWINAGHGGKDPGVVANGLQEKDIVLTLSHEIKKQLERDYGGV